MLALVASIFLREMIGPTSSGRSAINLLFAFAHSPPPEPAAARPFSRKRIAMRGTNNRSPSPPTRVPSGELWSDDDLDPFIIPFFRSYRESLRRQQALHSSHSHDVSQSKDIQSPAEEISDSVAMTPPMEEDEQDERPYNPPVGPTHSACSQRSQRSLDRLFADVKAFLEEQEMIADEDQLMDLEVVEWNEVNDEEKPVDEDKEGYTPDTENQQEDLNRSSEELVVEITNANADTVEGMPAEGEKWRDSTDDSGSSKNSTLFEPVDPPPVLTEAIPEEVENQEEEAMLWEAKEEGGDIEGRKEEQTEQETPEEIERRRKVHFHPQVLMINVDLFAKYGKGDYYSDDSGAEDEEEGEGTPTEEEPKMGKWGWLSKRLAKIVGSSGSSSSNGNTKTVVTGLPIIIQSGNGGFYSVAELVAAQQSSAKQLPPPMSPFKAFGSSVNTKSAESPTSPTASAPSSPSSGFKAFFNSLSRS